MKFAFVLLALAFAGAVLAFDGEVENGVYVLTPDNFDSFIAAEDFTLVEFYAPWCGHCKKLAPEYEAAASALDVKLAKVDASEHQSLGQQFGVTGFPTLVWFTKGEASPYAGGRTTDTIVSWVSKATTTEIPASTAEELAAAKADAKYAVVVLFGGSADDEAHQAVLPFFRNADDVTVLAVYDAETIAAEGAADGDIRVYAAHADEPATAQWSEFEEFLSFVTDNAYPRVVEFDNAQFARVSQQGEWLLLGVATYAEEGKKEEIISILEGVADADVGLLYADSAAMGRAVQGAGASGDVYPTVVGLNMGAQKQLVWNEENELTAESLNAWVAALKDGTAETFKKSEPIPEATNDAVVTLVYKNYAAETEGKKAFVKYYAPWCGHCKTLAPVWEELATAFADKDIVIGKFDATANHTDEPIQGFPTLIFYDGQGGQETYNGERTLEALTEFVESKL